MGCVYGKPTAIQDSSSKGSPRMAAEEATAVLGQSHRVSVNSSRFSGESIRAKSRLGGSNREKGPSLGYESQGKANASSRFFDEHVEIMKKKKKNKKTRAEIASPGCHPGAGTIPKALEAEQVAAGWPSWFATVAGEAIKGWVPRQADSFEKLNKIGQGTYSNVYKARDITNKKIVALKRVRFNNMDPESVKFMAREILILRRLDHQNVIKLEGLISSRMSCSVYLVFDYMEHDLTGLASIPGNKFSVPQVKCYMHQLLSGLEHCHSRGVLHRDIKGSNLLIDNSGILKIADFGLASFFDPDNSYPLTSRVVTLWYRPPELLLGASFYGVSVDLWSTGCILGELFFGKPIMPGRTEVEQLHKIFKLCGSPSDDFWRKSKLSNSTVFKPQRPYRRCVAEMFKDFPAVAIKLMETLLSIDPALRGTAASALKSEFFTSKPLACDPSSLPEYPPSKEIDAKLREEARRQESAGGMSMRADQEKRTRRDSRAVRAPNANADLMQKRPGHSDAKCRSEKFNRQQVESACGFPIDPPKLARSGKEAKKDQLVNLLKEVRFSGPLLQEAGRGKGEKKLDDPPRASVDAGFSIFSDIVANRLSSEDRQTKPASSLVEMDVTKKDKRHLRQTRDVSRKMEDGKLNVKVQTVPGHGSNANKIYFSGPLLVPSDNVDQMLKEHEQRLQEAVRRARIDKAKPRIQKDHAQERKQQVTISSMCVSGHGAG